MIAKPLPVIFVIKGRLNKTTSVPMLEFQNLAARFPLRVSLSSRAPDCKDMLSGRREDDQGNSECTSADFQHKLMNMTHGGEARVQTWLKAAHGRKENERLS
jgi:hypothetical protein